MPFAAFYHTHKLVVVLFILIYLIKAILLLFGNKATLDRFSKFIKIPEMVVSFLFFVTGIVMLNSLAEFTVLFTIKLLLVVIAIPIAVVAYRKYNKMLGVLAILLLISVYGVAEMYKAQFGKKKEIASTITDPKAADYNVTSHGKALYSAQCIVCHGEDGKANLAGAKDLTLSEQTDQEVIDLIKSGKNAMPKMASIYNDDELNALVSYVKSLR